MSKDVHFPLFLKDPRVFEAFKAPVRGTFNLTAPQSGNYMFAENRTIFLKKSDRLEWAEHADGTVSYRINGEPQIVTSNE